MCVNRTPCLVEQHCGEHNLYVVGVDMENLLIKMRMRETTSQRPPICGTCEKSIVIITALWLPWQAVTRIGQVRRKMFMPMESMERQRIDASNVTQSDKMAWRRRQRTRHDTHTSHYGIYYAPFSRVKELDFFRLLASPFSTVSHQMERRIKKKHCEIKINEEKVNENYHAIRCSAFSVHEFPFLLLLPIGSDEFRCLRRTITCKRSWKRATRAKYKLDDFVTTIPTTTYDYIHQLFWKQIGF